ncbi:MAG: hypothetical protein EB828_02635 [Nitrosopumilus sp. D6]|nr:MAG: hypothetical protein EB828_02635 [Nitrosopumilus sp. D6]
MLTGREVLPSPCREICKSFTKRRSSSLKRYLSGRVKCKPCHIWTDYTGCHLYGGSPAVPGSSGWYCNCCNKKVRMRPRTRVSKEVIRESMERAGKKTAY